MPSAMGRLGSPVLNPVVVTDCSPPCSRISTLNPPGVGVTRTSSGPTGFAVRATSWFRPPVFPSALKNACWMSWTVGGRLVAQRYELCVNVRPQIVDELCAGKVADVVIQERDRRGRVQSCFELRLDRSQVRVELLGDRGEGVGRQ